MKPKDYTNHSGGAKGADMTWDEIGRKYGVIDHVHWRPKDLESLSEEVMERLLLDIQNAGIALKRPHIGFKGVGYIQRNWLQVRYADAIYAIAHIVPPGESDYQGFENKTGKEIVAGGTGWAVEMAIQKGKRVYIFNMAEEGSDRWYVWNQDHNKFWPTFTPTLTKNFAGIGSRLLTPQGIQAIENVYIKTFNYAKKEEEIL